MALPVGEEYKLPSDGKSNTGQNRIVSCGISQHYAKPTLVRWKRNSLDSAGFLNRSFGICDKVLEYIEEER